MNLTSGKTFLDLGSRQSNLVIINTSNDCEVFPITSHGCSLGLFDFDDETADDSSSAMPNNSCKLYLNLYIFPTIGGIS
jgi:hypothetical protein